MKLFKRNPRLRRHAQRGATMVSTTLLSVSLLSASMLLVRQATRNANESGAVVARERALLAAQGGVQLAAAYYREQAELDANVIDIALAGMNAQGQNKCIDLAKDCIPGDASTSEVPTTGQRNSLLTGKSDCAGRPCMRPGALVVLPTANNGAQVPWVRMQMSELINGGDDEAVVTVWIRNNMAEALGDAGGVGGSWVFDDDYAIVMTAMAEVHGAVVTVEQEIILIDDQGIKQWEMASPELGYGGGHNNDSVAVETCADGVVEFTPPTP